MGLFTGLLDLPSRTVLLFIVVDKDGQPDRWREVGHGELGGGPGMQKVDEHQRERIRGDDEGPYINAPS
jgi:hypothetical protein